MQLGSAHPGSAAFRDWDHWCGFVKVPLCVCILQLDVFIVRRSFSNAALKRVFWILLLTALKPLGLCFSFLLSSSISRLFPLLVSAGAVYCRVIGS